MTTQAEHIIKKFGGLSAMASALGHKNPTTVQGWRSRGFIPARQQQAVLDAARETGIPLEPGDFFDLAASARSGGVGEGEPDQTPPPGGRPLRPAGETKGAVL